MMEIEKVRLEQADAQFIGFFHAKTGFNILNLVESMGLTEEEWIIIKKDYTSIPEKESKEIDEYFDNIGGAR